MTGARVRPADDKDAEPTEIRARFTIAADGAASRFAKPAGVRRDDSRPLGIAARRYYRTSYHPGPWFESWLDLWEGDLLLPGYGWLFPVAGGQINLGAGLLNTFKDFKKISAQRLFDAFSTMLPSEWGISEDTAEGRVLSGPLPMSLNRVPQAVPGMLLIGDAAGAVNPFNGEGIAYAMETAEVAADLVHEALVKDRPGHRDDVSDRAARALRRLLHDRPWVREADRASRDHEPRNALPAAEPARDGLRDAGDGEPHGRPRRRSAGPTVPPAPAASRGRRDR